MKRTCESAAFRRPNFIEMRVFKMSFQKSPSMVLGTSRNAGLFIRFSGKHRTQSLMINKINVYRYGYYLNNIRMIISRQDLLEKED